MELTFGAQWYMLQSAHSGLLTLDSPTAGVEIGLYDSARDAVALSTEVDGRQRHDATVAEGETFYVLLSGNVGTADLRIVNLVEPDGATVRVHGTAGDDQLTFDASAGHKIAINGVGYEFTPAESSDFSFDGLGGSDEVWLVGGDGAETATLRPSAALVRGSTATLVAVNVESTTFDGGGGEDLVRLYGSHRANHFALGGDKSAAEAGLATLSGGGVAITATAERLYVQGNGGKDTAELRKSAAADRFESSWRRAELGGDGHDCRIRGFESIAVQEHIGTEAAGAPAPAETGSFSLPSAAGDEARLIDAAIAQTSQESAESSGDIALDDLLSFLWLSEHEKTPSANTRSESVAESSQLDQVFALWK